MEFHDVANIFPMMSDEEYQNLVADIAANGLREPIWLHDGKIIDGRNRYNACAELGLVPEYRTWNGHGSLVAFVVSLNLRRRHLTSSQRAVVALEVEKALADEARKNMSAGGGDKRSGFQIFENPVIQPVHAAEQAASIVGTNRQYVSDAKKIAEQAPDLLDDIRRGEKTIQDAKRELKERAREEVREQNRMLIAQTPPVTIVHPGTYQTIVLDPPWDWGDEGDQDQFGRARPTYGTMSFEEIIDLPVFDLAAEDAHIYLWITNRSLPKGFELLRAWDFRYVTTLTWCKPSIGMGNYFRGSTEQVLFGVRGSLPLLRRDVGTWFEAPRPGRHSAKPETFYQLVESCSPGPWLEMFARQPRNGWVLWGAEACMTSN